MKKGLLHRAFALLLTGSLTFSGIVFSPMNTNAAQPVVDGVASTVSSGMFAANSLDNTWLFGGGVETQGRFAEIGGIRNYIGQFEEYVRWEKRVNGVLEGMQRYTINAGKAGQDARAFAENLEVYIKKIKPKAVSYLVGPEDYSQGKTGIAAFENAISEIIETSLDMKDGSGYAVIQLPHAVSGTQASNAALYAESARAAAVSIAMLHPQDAGRIAIVDHFSQTDNNMFKNSMLTDDGLLNANGHYQIARQFSQEIYGSVEGFPQISENWQAIDTPEIYLDTAPMATVSKDTLHITIPKDVSGDSWRYTVEIDGVTISGAALGSPFTVAGLAVGKPYLLTVCSADGTTQLSPVEGIVTDGNHAKEPFVPEGIAQEIRMLSNDKSLPLTWLFMGDSITHAAAHTHGYDGIAQLFEKYLKEDLGRTDDFVINTAVSGAQGTRTLENIEQRMKKYVPDIVSIMLGTNDAINEDYKNNLKRIVDAIRETNPNAIIIFRSPTPAARGDYATKLKGENGSVAYMKSVAEEDGNILFIDQYTEWVKEFEAYPYLYDSAHYFGDNFLHPGAAGQVHLFQQFIRECGLNSNTRTANLSYSFSYTKENSPIVPAALVSKNSVALYKPDLETAYGDGEIGDLEIILTDSSGNKYAKSFTSEENEAIIQNLPVSRHYTLSATANIKGATPKLVTFATQEITLSTGREADDLKAALAKYEVTRKGDLTVYTNDSASTFQMAYDAAQKAIDNGQTDVEILVKLCTDLEKAVAGLTIKTAPPTPPGPTLPGGTQGDGSTAPTPMPIQQGQVYGCGNYYYKVTDLSKLTVEVTGAKNRKQKQITVPNSVLLDGKTYTVTSVSASAFKNNKEATSAVIGKQVKRIGKEAFSGCTKLKTVSINSVKLKSIGDKAFFNCKKLTKLVVKSKVLKTVGKNALKGVHKKASVKVPAVKLKDYKNKFNKKGQGKQVKIIK